MGKKYPKKRRMSFFDYVLMMIAWSIWVVIMGMAIYGQLTENPGINMIVYMAICMIVSMSIGIYLKPREYSYVQLKEDGIYWKSVWVERMCIFHGKRWNRPGLHKGLV